MSDIRSEDTIKRSDAIKALGDAHFKNWGNAVMIIQDLPTIDAVPKEDYEALQDAFNRTYNALKAIETKRGEWIGLNDQWGFEGTFKCSACGVLWSLLGGTPQDNGMNFCPNCGADMRGKDDETD